MSEKLGVGLILSISLSSMLGKKDFVVVPFVVSFSHCLRPCSSSSLVTVLFGILVCVCVCGHARVVCVCMSMCVGGRWNCILQLALDAAEGFSHRFDIFTHVNLLNAELNPICNLLALVEAHHIFHITRIRVNVSGCQSQLDDRGQPVFIFEE